MTPPSQPSEPTASALVNRRGCRVIVRAADPANRREGFGLLPPGIPDDRRQRIPTLTGVGDELPRDTLPDCHDDVRAAPLADEEPGLTPTADKCPVTPIVPVTKERRPRPVTLMDGVDDQVAAAYRRKAAQILASGVYPIDDATRQVKRNAAAAGHVRT